MNVMSVELAQELVSGVGLDESALDSASAPAPAPAPAPAEEAAEEDVTDDLELVAVITAAIAASQNTSADGLVVRSIKRKTGAAWKRA